MEAAEERRERLKALKQAKQLLDEEQGEKVLRFRNYELRDPNIEHIKLPQAQPLPMEIPTAETEIHPDVLTEGIVDIAPKKLNYDLKRDVEEKLQLLEKRTHRALIQLQQEEERKRLEQEGGIADNEDVTEAASDSD